MERFRVDCEGNLIIMNVCSSQTPIPQRGGKLHGVTVADLGKSYGNGIMATREIAKKVRDNQVLSN